MSKQTLISSILIALIFLFGALSFNYHYHVLAQDELDQGDGTIDDGNNGKGNDDGNPGLDTPGTGFHKLKGYAWSSNVGWIRFDPNCSNNCGVYANMGGSSQNKADLSGFAWANPRDTSGSPTNNIGWLNFNEYSNCPTPPGGCSRGQIDYTGAGGDAVVTGWARFYSVSPNNSNAGGWDGWVHLGGSGYGGKVNRTSNQFTEDSYFWGGGRNDPNSISTPGWIHLCNTSGVQYCVSIETDATICQQSAPAAPTNLNASQGSTCGTINLSWTASTGLPVPTGYIIERSDSNSPFSANRTFTSTSNSTTDPQTQLGHTYYYRVAAVNSCGGQDYISGYSNVASVSTPPTCSQSGANFEFYARPNTVPKGGSCILHWNVGFAANCKITQPTNRDTTFPPSIGLPVITPPSTGSTPTNTSHGNLPTLLYRMTCTTTTGTPPVTASRDATCYVAGDYQHF